MCGVVPALLTAFLAVYRPGFLARFDDSVYDMLMRAGDTRPPDPRVVIVDVDEQSLSTVGQWPWPRHLVARLIEALRDRGAAVVALDIIFAETDRFGRVEQARIAPGGGPATPDEVLATTLRAGRVILGYGLTFDPSSRSRSACVLHPVSLPILHPSEETGETPFFHATGAVCSLSILAQSAGASGFLNAAPDSDGILRRVPLLAELDGRVYPSLALASVKAITGARDLSLDVSNVNAGALRIDEHTVPVDGKSNLLLRYRGEKRTFPYVSAADVLNSEIPAEMLRGKIVFVGTTALGTREVVATPLDTLFAGVEVQATVADNLLQQDFIRRSSAASTLEGLTALGLGIALAALVATAGIVSGVIGGAISIVGLWWGTLWLLSHGGVFLSPLAPTIGVTAALAVMTFAKFTVEHGRAESAGRDRSATERLMVQTLLSLTETRDAETGRHSRRTQQYARLLADELSRHPEYHEYLTPHRIDLLSSLAPLHDIGKVGIPDHILNKPGALTADELVEMRTHPVLGRDVILKAERQAGVRDDVTLAMAKDIVYTHHERWDGTGYPQGLRGRDIPVAGRVMAVVDVFDAVATRSLYKPPMPYEDAVKFIVKGRGTHFDPAVVDAFVKVAPDFRAISLEADRGAAD
jgi:adenylate cyclase